jgi:dynactin 1
MADEGPPLGTIVTTVQGLKGVVRFRGTTSFHPGKWVGIELHEKNGKNDGTVQGVKYFTCQMGYGIFVKPAAIKDIHGSELDAMVCGPYFVVHFAHIVYCRNHP